jgi:segregation and condensation protein B
MNKPIHLIVEALLFAAERPLGAREIHSWIPDVPLNQVNEALKALQAEYETLERSFVLKEVAQGYQFRTRSGYAPYVIQMLKTSPARLSRAALETLAIVAYKQPVLRQEIERLRGVDVGGILRTLLEKDLIKIMGRKHLPGRPLIYGTTKRFLEVFDLKDLNSLPKLREIREMGAEEAKAVSVPQGSPAPTPSGQEHIPREAEPTPEASGQEGSDPSEPS